MASNITKVSGSALAAPFRRFHRGTNTTKTSQEVTTTTTTTPGASSSEAQAAVLAAQRTNARLREWVNSSTGAEEQGQTRGGPRQAATTNQGRARGEEEGLGQDARDLAEMMSGALRLSRRTSRASLREGTSGEGDWAEEQRRWEAVNRGWVEREQGRRDMDEVEWWHRGEMRTDATERCVERLQRWSGREVQAGDVEEGVQRAALRRSGKLWLLQLQDRE